MEIIERECPLCDSTKTSKIISKANFDLKKFNKFSFASRKLPEYMHFRLFLCLECDLIYASPVLAPGILIKEYKEANFTSRKESYYASQTYGNFLPEIQEKLPDLVGVIDIGAGDGTFLEELISRGFSDVTGVEPCQASISSAKEEIRRIMKNNIFDPKDFRNTKFSLITCFQTLEHVYDPLQMCRNIFNMLKEGGAVLFACHNYRSLANKMLGLKSPIMDIEHLQLVSPRSLMVLLKKAGFTNIKIKTFLNKYPPYYWIQLLPLPLKFKLICISALKKAKIGDFPLQLPAGNIAAIGYKKIA